MKKKLFLKILLSGITTVSLNNLLPAQTGPGGVGNSATNKLWFKADALSLSNGQLVASWTDASGNGKNATQGNNTYKPVFRTAQINGLPAIQFDGSDDYLQTDAFSALNVNTMTWFSVHRYNAFGATNQVVLRTRYSSGASFNSVAIWGTIYYQPANRHIVHTSTSGGAAKGVNIPPSTSYIISSSIWNGATGIINGYFDGNFQGSNTGANASPSGHQYTRIGCHSGSQTQVLDGYLSEIIVYNTVLNNTQRIIIDNYLASKYGIAMTANDKYAYDAANGFEVVGIGRESAGNEHADAQGTGIVRINTASSLDDSDYLLWGHDNGSLISTTAGIPAEYGAGGRIIPRKWRADETGDVGTVTMIFDLTGRTFGDNNGYELLLDADGDFTAGATRICNGVSFDAGTSTLTITGVDFTGDLFFTVGNRGAGCSGTTTSIASANWDVGSTWNCGVPTACSNVVVAASTTPVVTAGAVCNNLTINASGILNGGTSTDLTMTGNIVVNGTLTGNTGTITMSGSTSNTISGTGTKNFANLTIDKSGGADVTVSSAMTVARTLDVNDGTLNTGGNITLLSTSSRTAAIGDLSSPSVGTISGNMTIQRYVFEIGSAKWYMLASPVTDATFSDWKSDFYMSGFPGSHYPSYWFKSVTTWIEATQTYPAPADVTNTITNGADQSGFFCYIGTDGIGPTPNMPKTLDLTGTPKTGTVTIAGLTRTEAGVAADRGWHLVGNPYASPINWTNVYNNAGTESAKISATARRMLKTGSYGDRTSGVGTPLLASAEGFWVEVITDGATLEFEENDKLPTAGDTYNQKEIWDSLLAFNIVLFMDSDYEDAPAQFFIKNSHLGIPVSRNYDPVLDAQKKNNILGKENIASVVDNKNISTNFIPDTLSALTIPIRVWSDSVSGTIKTYTLQFNSVSELWNNNKCLLFEDAIAGVSFAITSDTSYSVAMNDTTYTPRFFIHLSSPLSTSVIENNCYGESNGMITATGSGAGPFTYTWKDQAGDIIRNVTSSSADSLSNLSAGLYYLTVSGNGSCGTVSAQFEIEEPLPFSTSETVSDAVCSGSNTGFAVSQPDISGIYNYIWTNSTGDTLRYSTNVNGADTLSNIEAGQYNVKIFTTISCPSALIKSFEIASNPEISLISVQNLISCKGLQDGSVSIFNDNTGFSFLWSNGETTASVENLQTGIYSVTVTDASGCQKTETFTISEPDNLTISKTVTDVSCFGNNDGSIEIATSGGTPGYNYEWSTGNFESFITGLTPGIYSVTITDFNACQQNTSADIIQPEQIIPGFFISADTIDIANTDSVHFTNSSAGASSYQWDFGDGTTSGEFEPSHVYSSEGTYTVTLTAMAGQCSEIHQQSIVVLNTVGINNHNPNAAKIEVTQKNNKAILRFNLPETQKINLKLYNVLGQESISEKSYFVMNDKLEIPLPSTPGIYFMKISDGTDHYIFKLHSH